MELTFKELMEYISSHDKKLRILALRYIVTNIKPHGDRKTLRTLQACFIAGYVARQNEETN